MVDYNRKRKIGITTTVPVEVIYAGGAVPVDLNNIFINHPERERLIARAEIDGYPRNVCRWIKGIYATAIEMEIEEVVAVMQGDCSNTHALAETLQANGIRVIPFSYPYDGNRELLRREIEYLSMNIGVSDWIDVIAWKKRLDDIRKLAHRIDVLTWDENKVTGLENHIYLVSTSDFESDPTVFESKMRDFIHLAENRSPIQEEVRLAYIGVPPIFSDIYEVLEEYGARVVYNEVQRQFSMPYPTDDILEQYAKYTYPYQVFNRIADISEQIRIRNIDGIIHYAETFCFRQIEDIILRKEFDIPYIMIEGGESFSVDARTKMRIQTFVEMIKRNSI